MEQGISKVIQERIISEIESDILVGAQQSDSLDALKGKVDENSVSGMLAKTKKLAPEPKIKHKEVEKLDKGLFPRKEMDSLADGFTNREENREFRLSSSALSRLATSLGSSIKEETTYEDLIRLIKFELSEGAQSPDVSQIDKALDFLLEMIALKLKNSEGTLKESLENLSENISKIKMEHYQRFHEDIEMAHSVIGAANLLVSDSRSTKESLDHLRKMIHEMQDVHTKYKYYIEQQGYNYPQLKAEFKLLFHYMGTLVKKQLENAHLKQLVEEIKVLQAILGVYRQSEREIRSMFAYLKLNLSDFKNKEFAKTILKFEKLAALFFEISEERYPVPDRINQVAANISDRLSKELVERIIFKIAILNAIRNMVKEVAPTHLYRTLQHRDDLFSAVIDTLEELEDKLEEEQEDEEEQQESKEER